MILCCNDMAKLLEAKEECARRGEEAVSTAAFNALALAPTVGTLLSVSKALRLTVVQQELSYSAVLVLPVVTVAKAANDWFTAYRQYCVLAQKPTSFLLLVAVALVDIAVCWVLALL